MRIGPWFLAASLASTAALPIDECAAQTQPSAASRLRARENFRTGVAAYQRGDYSVALEAFMAAYRIAPNPLVRINLANCYVQLNRPVDALENFEQFLSESPNAPPEQRAEIQHQIDTLRGQVAEVHLALSPPVSDAIVSVDGRAVSVQNALRLAPGHHVVEASAEGYQPQRVEVDVTSGMRRDLAIELRSNAVAATPPPASPAPETPASAAPQPATTTATASAAPPPAPEAAPPPATSDLPVVVHEEHGMAPGPFYGGLVVTGVALISWATFGFLAISANSDFNDAANMIAMGQDVTAQMDRGHSAAQNARTFAAVSDACLGLTVVAAGITAFLFTRTNFNHDSVTVAPTATANGAGLSIGGSF